MDTQQHRNAGRIAPFLLLFLALTLGVGLWGKSSNANSPQGQGTEDGDTVEGLTIGGTELAPARYHLTGNVDMGDITFIGPTVIVADGDITISGHPTLTTSAEVTIYFGGDFTVSGTASINNQGKPANLRLYGTRAFDAATMTEQDRQRVTLNGDVDFAGVIYAPEAVFTSNGGGGKGATYGAIVAYSATFNGVPGPFHYDEALAAENVPDQPFSTSGYRPIRRADQLVENDVNLGTYEAFIDGFFGG